MVRIMQEAKLIHDYSKVLEIIAKVKIIPIRSHGESWYLNPYQ